MELQFQNKSLDCLRSILCCVKSQEQTQEMKLPEAMPDVAKVLGAWGQCVLRSKEWHNGRMSISGGVMAWVLYAPEDGSFPRVLEVWLPYQLHWELPQTQRDGTILVQPVLRRVDARVTSARKLMLRTCVEALPEALEPVRLDIFQPERVPESLCLLKKNYPVLIPVEAGEKTFHMEEELQLPGDCTDGTKLIHYSLHPQITEQKMVGNRLLLRGSAVLQGLCRGPEENLRSFSYKIPMSAYAELEPEFGEGTAVQVIPAVTELELEMMEQGKLRLNASVVGQYLVCARKLLELVEDAYQPGAKTQLQTQTLQIPAILEMECHPVRVEANQDFPAGEILDVTLQAGQPELSSGSTETRLQLSGVFQILYRDEGQVLQSAVLPWEQAQTLPADAAVQLCVCAQQGEQPDTNRSGNSIQAYGTLILRQKAISAGNISMVTGVEVTEESAADRPSLILRRAEGESLWEIAKACGSTEAAICQANGLTQAPEPNQILLIPVV